MLGGNRELWRAAVQNAHDIEEVHCAEESTLGTGRSG